MSAARGPALVVLAAGASRRLGTCKALVPLRERPPATPLALLLEAGAGLDAAPPLVVTGADHELVAAACPPGVEVLRNEAWERGRTGSVRAAARARPGLDLCLAPVDVPLVGRAVLDALAAAWRAAGAPPRGWLAPLVTVPEDGRHEGGRTAERPGHPVVVGRELLGELHRLADDEPLRALRARAAPLATVRVDDPAVLDDLDRPEDLARLRARLASPPPSRGSP